LVVLDLATEDEYWLNEVAGDAVIRETLSSMVRDELVEILDGGAPVDATSAAHLLADDESWTGSKVGFIATSLGTERYMNLGTEQLTALWRQAAREGYRQTGFAGAE
jgi:hypothetical protein